MTFPQVLPWIPVIVPVFLMIALPILPWLFGARAPEGRDKHGD